MNVRRVLSKTLIAVVCTVCASAAMAHTVSIGYVPGANTGEVTFYTGSYHDDVGVNEGALTLTGTGGTVYGPVTVNFNIPSVNVKPAGLVDGVNNCYWPQDSNLPLDCTLTQDPGISGGVSIWQGVTFTGLKAGTYSFTCGQTCGTSVIFNSWADGTGTVTLTGRDIGGGGADYSPVPTLSGLGLVILLALTALVAVVAGRRFLA